MLKYLNAELYKVTHRRVYTCLSLGIILAGEALLLFLLKFAAGDAENTFESVVYVLTMALPVGLYLAIMVCDMVFSDQYKLNTLKNEVSYGLSRPRVYFGKLLAEMVTAVVFCAAVVAFFLAAGGVIFPVKTSLGEALSALGKALAAALPLWLGGLGFFHMLLFVTKGSTIATVIYVLVMGVLDTVLELLALFINNFSEIYLAVRQWLPSVLFESPSGPAPDVGRCWLVGMVWLAVSAALGFISFQKREIN